jgi:hypothetical protein
VRHLTYSNVMATIAVFVAVGGGAYAVTSSSNKPVKACAKKQSGALRLLDKGKCKRSERAVRWNQKGRRGARGVAGLTGPAGAPAQGPTNADTLDGLDSPELQRALKATVIASPGATDAASGQNLRDAVAKANAAGAARTVYIEPGTYDLGASTTPLVIAAKVDLVGANYATTLIKSTGSATATDATFRTQGALTVRNVSITVTGATTAYQTVFAHDTGTLRINDSIINVGPSTTRTMGVDLAGGNVSLDHTQIYASGVLAGSTADVTSINTRVASPAGVFLRGGSFVSAQLGSAHSTGILGAGVVQVLGGSDVFVAGGSVSNRGIELTPANTSGVYVADASSIYAQGTGAIGVDAHTGPGAGTDLIIDKSLVSGNPGVFAAAGYNVNIILSQSAGTTVKGGAGTFLCFGSYGPTYVALGAGC